MVYWGPYVGSKYCVRVRVGVGDGGTGRGRGIWWIKGTWGTLPW